MAPAYHSRNACSNTPSPLCVGVIILYLGLIGLHIAYILTPIVKGVVTSNPILYILVALHFALIIAVIYDYVWIASHDPVDRLIRDPRLGDTFDTIRLQNLQTCRLCDQLKRLPGSHHCTQCGRCTEGFDHHCKYLNNCIGSKNYQKFIRLLGMNVLFLMNLIGQGIWVFLRAYFDERVRAEIPNTFWVIVGIMGASSILLIAISILFGFHCYISCCLNSTTLEYLFGGNFPKKGNKNIVLSNKLQNLDTQRELN